MRRANRDAAAPKRKPSGTSRRSCGISNRRLTRPPVHLSTRPPVHPSNPRLPLPSPNHAVQDPARHRQSGRRRCRLGRRIRDRQPSHADARAGDRDQARGRRRRDSALRGIASAFLAAALSRRSPRAARLRRRERRRRIGRRAPAHARLESRPRRRLRCAAHSRRRLRAFRLDSARSLGPPRGVDRRRAVRRLRRLGWKPGRNSLGRDARLQRAAHLIRRDGHGDRSLSSTPRVSPSTSPRNGTRYFRCGRVSSSRRWAS